VGPTYLHLSPATHFKTFQVKTNLRRRKVCTIGAIYRSFATRVSQLKIWHFWVTGVVRNVCRCTFNRYSVITQFAKLAAGEQLVLAALIENYSTSKPLKDSHENSLILICDTLVANERYVPVWVRYLIYDILMSLLLGIKICCIIKFFKYYVLSSIMSSSNCIPKYISIYKIDKQFPFFKTIIR